MSFNSPALIPAQYDTIDQALVGRSVLPEAPNLNQVLSPKVSSQLESILQPSSPDDSVLVVHVIQDVDCGSDTSSPSPC